MRTLRTVTVISLGLLLVTPGFALTLGASSSPSQPPAALEIPDFHIGDTAVYHSDTPGAVDEWTLRVDGAERVRDSFGQVREVPIVNDTAVDDPDCRQIEVCWGRAAIERDTGVLLWSERPNPGPDDNTIRRDHGYGVHWAFGASVLAGKTVEAGQQVVVPLPDGHKSFEAIYTFLDPLWEGDRWLWPVTIEFTSIYETGGLSTMESSPTEGTIYFDATSPFPVRAEMSGFFDHDPTYTRISFEPGDGPVAWTTDEVAQEPWLTDPDRRFDVVGPFEAPPEAEPPARYHPITVGEALAFAEENAGGFASFRKDHGPIVVHSSKGSGGGGTTFGPRSLALVQERTSTVTITFQELSGSDAWWVKVKHEKTFVAGQLVHERTRMDGEGPSTEHPEWGVRVDHEQALFDEIVASARAELGGTALSTWAVERTWTRLTWSPQDRYTYRLSYSPEDPDSFITWTSKVLIDASTGITTVVEGARPFLEAYDEHGWSTL